MAFVSSDTLENLHCSLSQRDCVSVPQVKLENSQECGATGDGTWSHFSCLSGVEEGKCEQISQETPPGPLPQNSTQETAGGFKEKECTPRKLKLILVGKTGTGKSATGNSILGKQVFESRVSTRPVTTTFQRGSRKLSGQELEVIDTPDILSPHVQPEVAAEEIWKALSSPEPSPESSPGSSPGSSPEPSPGSSPESLPGFKSSPGSSPASKPSPEPSPRPSPGSESSPGPSPESSPGLHAVLLVIQLGRFTEEDKQAVCRLEKIFGEGILAYTILVFTRKEDLDGGSLDDYVRETDNRSLADLDVMCARRHCGFNNRAQKAEQDAQLEDLMKIIEGIMWENNGHCYKKGAPKGSQENILTQEQGSEVSSKGYWLEGLSQYLMSFRKLSMA